MAVKRLRPESKVKGQDSNFRKGTAMTESRNGERRRDLLHQAYAAADVRAMERPLLDRGVPLMRMAASAVARTAVRLLDGEGIDVEDADVVLLAGAGDNGGDGLYAAAALADEGAHVTCVAVGRSLHDTGFAAFVRAGGKVLVLDPDARIPGCSAGFSAGEAGERLGTAVELARSAHLVIDAMTGIGLVGALRGIAGTVARLLSSRSGGDDAWNRTALPNREPSGDLPLVLAVDAPSGVGIDDGSLTGPAIPADVTVTFGALKPCAVLPPATFACGAVELVDFGFELDGFAPAAVLADAPMAADAVRLPRIGDAKYSRGVVGLVTGSSRYPGAAVLTATAAARTNVGMVRHMGPARTQDMVLAALPEAVLGKGHVQAWTVGCGVPAADDDGADDDVQRRTIASLLAHYDAKDGRSASMPPVVVDAGALDLLPDHVPPQVVITPHAGEMARLMTRIGHDSGRSRRGSHASSRSAEQVTAADVSRQPLRFARLAQELTGATVLLKGAATVVVGAGSPAYVCGTAPAWLSTAGAGDVLAGMLGALLAQDAAARSDAGASTADDGDGTEDDAGRLPRLAAAGAVLHGQAAAIAAETDQHGVPEPTLAGHPGEARFAALGHPIVAGDVVRAIPEAFVDVLS